MTEIATREAPTPAAIIANGVRSDEFRQQIAAALPPAVTADRFIRVALTAIQTNDDIAACERNSVIRAFIRCATDGLMPDGREAAIVKRNRKHGDRWIAEASYMPMIGGYRKKLAEHGWTLRTAVVYANDEFDHAVVDGDEVITHRPVRPGADRGELIAAYAVAKHRDGRKLMTVLHPADIAKRRETSQTANVWEKHPAAMWEKSAGRDVYDQVGLAEVDAERDRIAGEIAANFAGDAVGALYSPREELPAAPAAAAPVSDAPTMAATSDRHETGTADQQAGGATDEPEGPLPASNAAPSVPGTDTDEEPDVGEPEGYNTPATVPDDDAVVAAGEAAGFTIPNGKNRGKTLAEMHATGDDGVSWIGWALRNIGWPTPKNESDEQYRNAVWAFARVHEPDLYQGVYASKQAEGLIH